MSKDVERGKQKVRDGVCELIFSQNSASSKMALFVGKDRIGKGCNEGGFAVVAPMPEAEEG
jgi:hypothetical protein